MSLPTQHHGVRPIRAPPPPEWRLAFNANWRLTQQNAMNVAHELNYQRHRGDRRRAISEGLSQRERAASAHLRASLQVLRESAPLGELWSFQLDPMAHEPPARTGTSPADRPRPQRELAGSPQDAPQVMEVG
jgi:hypothetical protein